MFKRKSFLALSSLVLVSVLVGSLFYYNMVQAQGVKEYSPWCDINDDGKINIRDVAEVASRCFTEGDSFITKAGLTNNSRWVGITDSGWFDITDKAGQFFNITHNLNSTDIIVDITGKMTPEGGVHQRNLGRIEYTPRELIILLNRTNDPEWSETYGGENRDEAYSMVQTCDGGYAIAGYTHSFGAGGADFWLVKTDWKGCIQWSQTYGGTGNDYASSVIQTCDGGYAIAGWEESFGAGDFDFWLIKTNSTGHEEWNKTYGGPNKDEVRSLVQTCDGGYAIAGFNYSSGEWDSDFWLVKTDSDGNMEWNGTYGGENLEQATSLIRTCDGGYAIAGYTKSFGAGDFDFWLIKTNSTGHEEWNKTYGGTEDDQAHSLVQTCDGGYAMAGYTYSFGAGERDFWLIRTGAESGLAWTDSTADTITLYRGATDPYWNYVRVRIWEIKETP